MKKIVKYLALALAVAFFVISGYYDIARVEREITPAVAGTVCSVEEAHEHDLDCGYTEGIDAVDCDSQCDHSDCSYVEFVDCEECIPAHDAIECDHADCSKADAVEPIPGVACDFDAEAYETEISSYFTIGSYGWTLARVEAFDADLNRLWFFFNFNCSVDEIKVTLTDELGNTVVAVAKYNALAGANAGYVEIAFRDAAGSVYPFAHNGYWDTILTQLEEGVNEVATLMVEVVSGVNTIVAAFDGNCDFIAPECDHTDCAYVEVFAGLPAVPCDVEAPATERIPCGDAECPYTEAVECDNACDHSECAFVAGVEAIECSFTHEHDEDCGYIAGIEAEVIEMPVGDAVFNWITKGEEKSILIFRLVTLGAGLVCLGIFLFFSSFKFKKKRRPVIATSIPKHPTPPTTPRPMPPTTPRPTPPTAPRRPTPKDGSNNHNKGIKF